MSTRGLADNYTYYMPGHGASPIDASGFNALRNAGGAGTVLDPNGNLIYSNANYDLPVGAPTTGTQVSTTPSVNTESGSSFKEWFTPGAGGSSVGGQVLGGVAAGVGALTGLAGLYLQKKNLDLQKDHQKYLKSRDKMSDDRSRRFAQNVGNNASF